MRFNKLDLHLRVAPGAMLALHSISRATEQLHISQSAMRNALARLRKYFADDLLVQVGRKMELTPRAETLRETVHGMLLRVDTTITAMPQCRNAAIPLFVPAQSNCGFRFSLSDYTMVTLISRLLALAHRQSKTVRFRLLPQVGHAQRALKRGRANLLVVPTAYCSAEHPAECLFDVSFCGVV